MLVVAEEDVIDGQPSAHGVLPRGVCPQADAAAFERQQGIFERGQRAAEAFHLLAGDGAAVARLEGRVGQAVFEQLGLHLLFGLHVVGFLPAAHAEQRRLGHVDVPARTRSYIWR